MPAWITPFELSKRQSMNFMWCTWCCHTYSKTVKSSADPMACAANRKNQILVVALSVESAQKRSLNSGTVRVLRAGRHNINLNTLFTIPARSITHSISQSVKRLSVLREHDAQGARHKAC